MRNSLNLSVKVERSQPISHDLLRGDLVEFEGDNGRPIQGAVLGLHSTAVLDILTPNFDRYQVHYLLVKKLGQATVAKFKPMSLKVERIR